MSDIMPTLNDKELDWVTKAVGHVPKFEAAIDIEARKQALLKQARLSIDGQVGDIQVGEDFEVTTLSDFLKRRITMASIGETPDEELDTGHDTGKMTGMDPKDFQQLIHAQSIIVDEVAKLRAEKNPQTKKPLFTDKEIAEAIWAPLMRRKLIPENAIPDRYSEVARSFSGASNEYQTRLAAYTDTLTKNSDMIAGFTTAKDVIDGLGGLATGLVVDISLFDPRGLPDPYQAVTMIKGIQAGLSSTTTIATEYLKAGSKLDKTSVQAICKDLSKSVPGLINAGFASSSWNEVNLGKAIAYAVTPLFSAPAVLIKIKDGNYVDLLDEVAALAQAACNAYTYTEKSMGKTDLGPGNAGVTQWNDVGSAIANSILALKSTIKVATSPEKMDTVALLELLKEYAAGAIDAASQWKFDENKKEIELEGAKHDVAKQLGIDPKDVTDEQAKHFKEEDNKKATPEQKEPDNQYLQQAYGINDQEAQALRDGIKDVGGWANMSKLLKEVQAQGTTAIDKLEKNSAVYKALEKIANNPTEEAKEAKRMTTLIGLVKTNGTEALTELSIDHPAYQSLLTLAKIVDQQNQQQIDIAKETFDQELEDSDREFRDLLNRGDSGDSEADVEKIEQLMAQMVHDRLIVDMCLTLVSLPAQAVAAFLPQAGMAVAAIDLMKNIRKAILHFKAYAEWQENVRDARSAMSVQVEAMTNRVDLSRSQGSREVVSALENAAKIAGGALSCAGPFAPAGHAVTATVQAVSSLRTMCLKFYDKKQLDDSWKLYQAALERPDDRKIVRKAIRTNPTLSKYVIAWGAEDGNPVAKSALQKCGLTADVLSNKNTNVQKVTAFLEALYPDDPVLLQPVGQPAEWYPGPVEFKSDSLAMFAGAAERGVKLEPGAAKELIVALGRLERAVAAATAARAEWLKISPTLDTLPKTDNAPPTPEEKAVEELVQAVTAARSASLSMLNALKAFKPMGTDKKPHAGFAAYAKLLVAPARQFAEKYQRELEAVTDLREAA